MTYCVVSAPTPTMSLPSGRNPPCAADRGAPELAKSGSAAATPPTSVRHRARAIETRRMGFSRGQRKKGREATASRPSTTERSEQRATVGGGQEALAVDAAGEAGAHEATRAEDGRQRGARGVVVGLAHHVVHG